MTSTSPSSDSSNSSSPMKTPHSPARTASPAFVSRSEWLPDRPETLVVCCSDGRWHAPISEFVDSEVSERADLYAVPGGPAAFDAWNSSFEEARVFESAMRLFVEHHDLRTLWLIRHEGCAYYKVKHAGLDAAALIARQIADLRRAARISRERYPKLAVRAILATLKERRAVFTLVDTADAHDDGAFGPSTKLS